MEHRQGQATRARGVQETDERLLHEQAGYGTVAVRLAVPEPRSWSRSPQVATTATTTRGRLEQQSQLTNQSPEPQLTTP